VGISSIPENGSLDRAGARGVRVNALRNQDIISCKDYFTAMDESELYKIYLKAAGSAVEAPEDARQVFGILVSSTLHYRDLLKDELGVIVTVEDVRIALDWLLESIDTKRLPESNNAVRLGLLKIWLDELKPYL
jgi:hypothetical protein